MLDLFIGRRELGKTTLAVATSRYFSTRVYFDPRHMIETTSDVLTDQNVRDGLLYEMLNDRAEVIVQPENVNDCFAWTCREIRRWITDNPGEQFFFLVDEVRFIENPEANTDFDFLVRTTPRESFSVGLTCHGVPDVSTDLRRIADYWLLFQLTLEADLARIRERCGDTVAFVVQGLKPYEYVVWNDAIQKWKKHTNSAQWFVDIKKIGREANASLNA